MLNHSESSPYVSHVSAVTSGMDARRGSLCWLITSFIGGDCSRRQRRESQSVNKAPVLQLFLFWSPTCLQRANGRQLLRRRQTIWTVSHLHSGWAMETVLCSRHAVAIIQVGTRASSYVLLNPIALLVKSTKEMILHFALARGINQACRKAILKLSNE